VEVAEVVVIGSSVSEWEQAVLGELKASPGLNTAEIRAVRCKFTKALSKASPELVIELARRLMKRGNTIHRFVASELIQFHRLAFLNLNKQLMEEFSVGLDSWGAVDVFSCYLSGPAWREGLIDDRLIRDWTRSTNRWLRRAALVSTVPLNSKARGGSGEKQRTLAICEMLVSDRDDMVVKALSWALRELSKRDPDSVRKFVAQHSKVLSPRVTREVNNKLRTGLKNPKRVK
jgi:3-methyladenine DNA glycosylase AlkD